MNIKKLIPLFTICSAASIVTPLVTSCGDGYTNFEITAEGYEYVEPKTAGSMKESDATKIYFTDVKSNYKILADDIAQTMVQPTNDTTLKITIGIKSVNVNDGRVAVKIKTFFSGEVAEVKTEMEISQMWENLPWKVVYNEANNSDNIWTMMTAFNGVDAMKKDKSWRLSSCIKTYDPLTEKYEETKQKTDYKSSDQDIQSTYDQLQNSMQFRCFYLSNIAKEV